MATSVADVCDTILAVCKSAPEGVPQEVLTQRCGGQTDIHLVAKGINQLLVDQRVRVHNNEEGQIVFQYSAEANQRNQRAAEFEAAAESEARLAKQHRTDVLNHCGSTRYQASDFKRDDPNDWKHTDGRDNYTSAEVAIGKRCHGFHLELLKMDVTPASSHYKLIHYDVPLLDPKTHVLHVKGLVKQELHLSVAEIKQRPSETHAVLMACAGTGRSQQKRRLWTHAPWGPDAIGCAEWTGCSLADLLRECGPLADQGAAQVIFTGADRGVEGNLVQYFQRSLTLDQAMKGHVLLCHAMNGQDLSPAHGAPVRIIVPGWYGMASVKWLTSIEVVKEGWWGYQMDAYSIKRTAKDPEAVPLQQLPVRALMAPPGFPDFVSRTRVLSAGTVRVEGKAWAGSVALERVEFSGDNGTSWRPAQLGSKNGTFGWASWWIDWVAEEGTHVLCCRAFDKEGRCQDRLGTNIFNYGAFGCTQPQQVYVKVVPATATATATATGGGVVVNPLAPGQTVDLEPEQKAAKEALREDSGLPHEFIQALYQAPGSQ